MREIYQEIYSKNLANYGRADKDRCPGVRLFPQYRHWLKGLIIDMGSGTGDTVRAMRQAGYQVDGMDQVSLDNGMLVGDITVSTPLLEEYDTAVCIDVMEHISDEDLTGLMMNLQKCQRQVITVYSGSNLAVVNGKRVELHINQKPMAVWDRLIKAAFIIKETIRIKSTQTLYLCETLVRP